MQKLAVVLGVLLVVLLGVAPLPARADDLPQTEVKGTVQASGITGLPASARVKAEWETTVSGSTAGNECEVKNVTNPLAITRAKGTTGGTTTNAPSNHLACTIATSTITGIVAGNVLCVDVNFSAATVIPTDGAPCTNPGTIASNTWRIKIDGATAPANTVTSSIRELEVDPGDD